MIPSNAAQLRFRPLSLTRRTARFDVYDGERVTTGERVTIRVWRSDADEPCIYIRPDAAALPLTSNHVAIVHEIDEPAPGRPRIVTEYLDGEDLRTRVVRRGPLSPTEVAPLIVDVLSGLAEAHDHRIVHGSIDLENIYVVKGPDGQERAKIVDFGIHKPITRQTADDEGDLTPIDVRAQTPQADIRAVGLALCMCIKGQRPRDEDEDDAEVPRDFSGQFPRVDPTFALILGRAIAEDGGSAYPSARAFHFALTQWLQQAIRPPRSSDRDVGDAGQHTPYSFRPAHAPVTAALMPELPSTVPPPHPAGPGAAPAPPPAPRRAPLILVGALAVSGILVSLAVIIGRTTPSHGPPVATTSASAVRSAAALPPAQVAQATGPTTTAEATPPPTSMGAAVPPPDPRPAPPPLTAARPVADDPPRFRPLARPAPAPPSAPTAADDDRPAAARTPQDPSGNRVDSVQGRPIRTEL